MAGVHVSRAETAAQLDAVRALVRAFVSWHRARHVEDLHLIDAYFDAAALEAELDSLPGAYAPPAGRLLLATVDGAAAGCVALHAIGPDSCEMKRMFVYSHFHGRGVGSALTGAIVEQARAIGYGRMRLDTSHRQIEAQRLYARHGFSVTPPYYDLPEDLRSWLVFMELDLSLVPIARLP